MKRFPVLLIVAWVQLASASAASAATYSFTNIIDSTAAAPTGNYFGFADATISGNRVAFQATYDQGFLGQLDGILTSSGGPRTLVVRELSGAPQRTDFPPLGNFSSFGRPVIDGNTVYFAAHVFYSDSFSYGDGIFNSHGDFRPDGPDIVAAVQSTFYATSPYFSLTDPLVGAGQFAYRASTSGTTPDSLYLADDCTRCNVDPGTKVIGKGSAAPSGGTFTSIDANYGFSSGTLVFRGTSAGQTGIFTVAGASPAKVVAPGDPTPLGGTFTSVLDPAISNSAVAFLGAYAGGSGIFTASAGSIAAVVTTSDVTPSGKSFASFAAPAIGGEAVAFRATLAGGGSGLYTKRIGSEVSKVVEIGDPLFGSTVSSFSYSDLGLDPGGSANVAFTYSLADGRIGVAMAYAGPAPPTIYQRNGAPVLDSVGVVSLPTVNLAHRNLTNAMLAGAEMANADVQGANLTNSYMRSADLTNANLSGTDLSNAVLDAARLGGANFASVNLHAASVRREFVTTVSCNFTCVTTTTGYGGIAPAQLYGTVNYQARDLTGIDFDGNNFTNANLAQQNLNGSNLHAAILTGVNLAGAQIRGTSFGRYARSFGCEGHHGAINSCHAVTNTFGTGLSPAQISSTASFQVHDLVDVDLSGNVLNGINLAEQNLSGALLLGANLTSANLSHAILTNANLGSVNLTGANLFGADSRGSDLPDSVLAGAAVANLIRPDGHIRGLDVGNGQKLLVRDYDGDLLRTPDPLAPIPVTVDQQFTLGAGGTLRIEFDADNWESTISFAAGISVQLGGSLQLALADGVDPLSQIGRKFRVFDWTGVAPTGTPAIDTPYVWDLSKLATTGEVTFLALSGLPGDFNHDGLVNAADYTVWRDQLNAPYPAEAYSVWKSRYGSAPGAGGLAALGGPAIPEPSMVVSVLPIVILVGCLRLKPNHD